VKIVNANVKLVQAAKTGKMLAAAVGKSILAHTVMTDYRKYCMLFPAVHSLQDTKTAKK
jgi:hypothetical protein